MATINDDVILAVLACCDVVTVAKCRSISKHFKHIIDEELALDNADFSTLTFRQRRNITDSVMTPKFTHIFRRASYVNLNGTGIGHYGAMKLVTDYTKELHVERCPRVDIERLIQAIAGDRWLSYDLDPVCLYVKSRETRGSYNYLTVIKPLSDYNWAVVMMSNDCPCQYVKIEEYQEPELNVAFCHACNKAVEEYTFKLTCNRCGFVTCKECQAVACVTPSCAVFCKGCVTEVKCSLCHNEWCMWCRNVWVFQCYGCEANVCGECQPSHLKCSKGQYHEYCSQCAGAMADKHGHWCCDAGEFSIEPTR
ncbi:hypothetical protein BGZ79_010091 [Entomortierella chlamydospora]|nr:hypothetical protein BGZ79_010091 [Entomortierella chlamydospora]